MFLNLLWKKFIKSINEALSFLSLFLVAFYQSFLSGTLGMGACCRFYPSCSDYALLAYKGYPFLQATKMVGNRLLKCHPFGPSHNEEALGLDGKIHGTEKRKFLR